MKFFLHDKQSFFGRSERVGQLMQGFFFNLSGWGFITINPLKPTGYVVHQQFNVQQLYTLPTLYLCVLYLSENKQRLVPLTV